MSAITLQDGSTVGDIVSATNEFKTKYYGAIKHIDPRRYNDVEVLILVGALKGHVITVPSRNIRKLTEEVVSNCRQQLATELQELEAAWEVARHK